MVIKQSKVYKGNSWTKKKYGRTLLWNCICSRVCRKPDLTFMFFTVKYARFNGLLFNAWDPLCQRWAIIKIQEFASSFCIWDCVINLALWSILYRKLTQNWLDSHFIYIYIYFHFYMVLLYILENWKKSMDLWKSYKGLHAKKLPLL